MTLGSFLKLNFYDDSLVTVDEDLVDEAYGCLMKDVGDEFFKYIEDECQLVPNIVKKIIETV